jgi:hypothetical protein
LLEDDGEKTWPSSPTVLVSQNFITPATPPQPQPLSSCLHYLQLAGAIASNIWSCYQVQAESFGASAVTSLMFDCEVRRLPAVVGNCPTASPRPSCLFLPPPSPYQNGRVVVTPASKLLLCIIATPTCGFGLCKAKVSATPGDPSLQPFPQPTPSPAASLALQAKALSEFLEEPLSKIKTV